MMNKLVNTSVRQNEIKAEILPLDKAVKNPLDITLNPLKIKLIENNLNPATVKS